MAKPTPRAFWRLDAAMIATFVAIASLLLTFGSRTGTHDADSVLTTFMSTQRMTWYYWDQNRFGNLLPAATSMLSDFWANFHAQVILRNLCALCSVFAALFMLGARDRVAERFFAAVMVLFASPGLAVFGTNVPQAISCAVLAAGLWLSAAPAHGVFLRLLRWVGVTSTIWLSFYVNISLLVLVLPIAGLSWLIGATETPFLRFSMVLSATVAAGAAYWHAKFFPPETPSTFNFSFATLGTATGRIVEMLDVQVIAFIVLVLIACATVFKRWRQPSAAQIATLAGCAIAVGIYASMTWVQDNGNAGRYYFAVMIVLLVALSSAVVSSWPDRLPMRYAFAAIAMAAVIVRSGPPIKDFVFVSGVAGREHAINRDIPKILRELSGSAPLVLIGSYWFVTPLGYMRAAAHRNNETYLLPLEGAHDKPTMPFITKLIRGDRDFTVLCVMVAIEHCKSHLRDETQADVSGLVLTRGASGPLESGESFTVLSASRREMPETIRSAPAALGGTARVTVR